MRFITLHCFKLQHTCFQRGSGVFGLHTGWPKKVSQFQIIKQLCQNRIKVCQWDFFVKFKKWWSTV